MTMEEQMEQVDAYLREKFPGRVILSGMLPPVGTWFMSSQPAVDWSYDCEAVDASSLPAEVLEALGLVDQPMIVEQNTPKGE